MSFFMQYPASSGGGSGSNASVGTNGITAPTSSTEVAGINPLGNLQPLQTDSSGNLKVALASEIVTPLNTMDAADGTPGTNAPVVAINIGGTDPNSGFLQALAVASDGSITANISSTVPATDPSTTGTVTAANSVSISSDGLSSATIEVQSISSITLTVHAFSTSGSLIQQLATADSTGVWTTAGITSTGSYRVASPAGFGVLQVIGTGGGTATIAIEGSVGVNTLETRQANAANLNATIVGNTAAGSGAGTGLVTVQGNASGTPVPISGTVTATVTGVATSANQTNGTQVTQITGTVPLPTGAATSANQTSEITQLTAINSNTSHLPTALGSATSAASLPVVIASDQGTIPTSNPDTSITGQGTQTVLNNNIILAVAGAGSTTATGFRSASVQINSTGTGGAYIFEGSNDNSTWVSIPVYNQLILTGTPISAAVTVTAVNIVYIFPLTTEFVRCRISTAVTGGSLQAFTRLSSIAWVNPVIQVAQTTAANLATTATIASGTVTTVTTVGAVTKGNIGMPSPISDIASGAIVTTTTSATITPTFGTSYNADVAVTAGVGTGTFQVAIQELYDNSANWVTVYTFPATVVTASVVVANATLVSPIITMTGTALRYVQTLTGVTSITRTVVRNQSSQSSYNVPSGGNLTDASGTTSATPSTATTALVANSQRKYLLIQNTGTNVIWFNFTTTAVASQPSYELVAGGSFVQESGFVSGEAISVLSASASAPYALKWA